MQTFEHLALTARKGYLVNFKGEDVYMSHFDRPGMPICFISGHPQFQSRDVKRRLWLLQGQVLWSETQNARDEAYLLRVLNGYVKVRLVGESIEETFIGEDGSVRWSSR